jgi:hypothetical protein
MRVGSVWYSRGSTVAPSDIPVSLIDLTLTEGGAQQTFVIGDQYYYAVAVYTRSGLYVELFPLAELLETLRNGALLLVLLALGAFVVGGAVGRYLGGLLLRGIRTSTRSPTRSTRWRSLSPRGSSGSGGSWPTSAMSCARR